RLPFEQPPGSDRAGLHPHDGKGLRRGEEEWKRRDFAPERSATPGLHPPAEGDERALERTGQPLRQLEGEVLPVGFVERPDVDPLAEDRLLEPDRNRSVADVAVRRPAQEALATDELRRDVEPAGVAADVDEHR